MISIIMPHKLGRQQIHRAVQSIHRQEFQDWELIIICDGKADVTPSSPKEQVHETEHTGRYGNVQRHLGIDLAKGDYIIFLDDDDLFTETCLIDVMASLKKWEYPDILIGKTYGQHGFLPHLPFTRPVAGSIGGGNIIIKSWLAKKVGWPEVKHGTFSQNRYCDFKFLNACWYLTEKTYYDSDLLISMIPRFSMGT